MPTKRNALAACRLGCSFHSAPPPTQHRHRDPEADFLPHAPVDRRLGLTRSIADVPLGLDRWMDISGNILSMRLITSSTYLRGKRKHLWVRRGLVTPMQVHRALQLLFPTQLLINGIHSQEGK